MRVGEDSIVRCMKIGADDYLPKPFNPVILRTRMNTGGLAKKRLHDLQRARVHDVFSRFLPEHVVDDVLERTDDDLRLGGAQTTGTVMFTDLRGFTASPSSDRQSSSSRAPAWTAAPSWPGTSARCAGSSTPSTATR